MPVAAALSQSQRSINITNVSPISPDSIGVPHTQNRSYWDGTPYQTATQWLSVLPTTASPTLKQLITTLLSVSTPPPISQTPSHTPGELLEKRLLYLMRLSQFQTTLDIIQHIPKHFQTFTINQIQVMALLMLPDITKACQHVEQQLAHNNHTFWQKALLICQFSQHQADEAELHISLLQEQKILLPDETIQQLRSLKTAPPSAQLIASIFPEFPGIPSASDIPMSNTPIPDAAKQYIYSILTGSLTPSSQEMHAHIIKLLPNTIQQATFYLLANIFIEPTPLSTWKYFSYHSLSIPSSSTRQNHNILHYTLAKQLHYLSQVQRTGESLLVLIALQQGLHPSQISPFILEQSILSLRQLGFEKEALSFAMESLQAMSATQ